MEPAALPAAKMISRPEGGAGKCGRKQPSGCAAATAVRNSSSRKARGDSVKAQASRAAGSLSDISRHPRRSWFVLMVENSGTEGATGINCAVIRCKACWKARRCVTIVMAARPSPPPPREGTIAMALDDKTQTELEAAAFRRLLEHLRARTDVQNIDLMNLAGFCRNCLSNWMKDAADARGVPMSKDESREIVYGMPYDEWKAKHQPEASPAQRAAFEKAAGKH